LAGLRAAFTPRPGSDAQPLTSAAQLLRIRIFAASYEYIPSLAPPQKSRLPGFFTSRGATFSAPKFSLPKRVLSAFRLCYYRQRSLKIFRRLRLSEELDRNSDA
jgi:hypothetical protein